MYSINIFISILFLSLSYLQECPPNDTLLIEPIQNEWDIPVLNNWNNIDIMTWNIENFPQSDNTVTDVVEIITDILPDVITFQELSIGGYNELEDLLPSYGFIRTDYNSPNFTKQLGIAYRNDCVVLNDYNMLFTSNEDWEFAYRLPLKADLTWQCGDASLRFDIINVHLKAFPGEEECERRYLSSEILLEYIQNHEDDKIIISGDFNDEITDSELENCLWPLVNSDDIYFVTNPIANNQYYDSYPSYNSFIDHILINNNVLNQIVQSEVNTIRLDDYIGWSYYQNYISDHRPVTLNMTVDYEEIPTGIVINEIMNRPSDINGGNTYGEWFEITNIGNQSINLLGYVIRDNDNDEHMISENLFISPQEFLVLGAESDSLLNGGITIDYEYDDINLSNIIDEIVIEHPYGIVIDEVIYNSITDSSFQSSGISAMLLDPELDNSLGNNWFSSTTLMDNGDYGTPGQSNISECEPNLDLNQDGYINIIDIISLVNHIIGESILEDSCIADFDADGNINIVDIVYIVSYIIEN